MQQILVICYQHQNGRTKGNMGNSTRGIFAGGGEEIRYNRIYTIASTGNSIDFGDLGDTSTTGGYICSILPTVELLLVESGICILIVI